MDFIDFFGCWLLACRYCHPRGYACPWILAWTKPPWQRQPYSSRFKQRAARFVQIHRFGVCKCNMFLDIFYNMGILWSTMSLFISCSTIWKCMRWRETV